MVVLMESGTNTKFYKPVSQIACICVSFILVLNIHIPLYLDSRGEPFFRTSKFFSSLFPVSIISICISFSNCHFFIFGHCWLSILCHWHWLVWCDTASLWHFFQSSDTWMRRCILADGFFLLQHFLLPYFLVIVCLGLIELTSNHFHFSHSYMSNWYLTTRMYVFVQTRSGLSLYKVIHMNCLVFNYSSYHIPIYIIIGYFSSCS
jgi:hypothetical protein